MPRATRSRGQGKNSRKVRKKSGGQLPLPLMDPTYKHALVKIKKYLQSLHKKLS
jgi:hypothetical protein